MRTEIGGEEVNFFAKARQNGADVVIVGESVLKEDIQACDLAKSKTRR